MSQGQMPPGLAAHYAQQAAQHALRQPHNAQAHQQAAAWAAQAAAPPGIPHQPAQLGMPTAAGAYAG